MINVVNFPIQPQRLLIEFSFTCLGLQQKRNLLFLIPLLDLRNQPLLNRFDILADSFINSSFQKLYRNIQLRFIHYLRIKLVSLLQDLDLHLAEDFFYASHVVSYLGDVLLADHLIVEGERGASVLASVRTWVFRWVQ